jgi:hypothetical protein
VHLWKSGDASRLAGILGALALLAGCAGRHSEVRGRPPSGTILPAARLAAAPAGKTVTVRGTMVEK